MSPTGQVAIDPLWISGVDNGHPLQFRVWDVAWFVRVVKNISSEISQHLLCLLDFFTPAEFFHIGDREKLT